MSIGFYYPSKAKTTESWVPANGPVFPISSPEDFSSQIILRSGDGTIHVQSQGESRKSFELNFRNSSKEDVESYRAFFQKVQKSLHSFQYKDGTGSLQVVRIMNGFNFKKDGVLSFSGSIQLEAE